MAYKINNGYPAFPLTVVEEGYLTQVHTGMSLRDWFAGKALANVYTASETNPDKIADWAYQIADAMLAARAAHEGK